MLPNYIVLTILAVACIGTYFHKNQGSYYIFKTVIYGVLFILVLISIIKGISYAEFKVMIEEGVRG